VPALRPPFMNHIATVLLSFSLHRMSAIPSPSKSPTPLMIQSSPGFGIDDEAWTVPPFMNQKVTMPVVEDRQRTSDMLGVNVTMLFGGITALPNGISGKRCRFCVSDVK